MKPKTHPLLSIGFLAGLAATAAHADFNPVPLTPDSYNADIIVEKAAPPPLQSATSASMDGGNANNGNTWYETGYNPAEPGTGLPAAGSTLTHETDPAKQYLMPASYVGNNAVFIDAQNTTGTLTLTTPAAHANLSFLSASGGGACVIDYTVHFADSSTEVGTISSGDWFGGVDAAWTANGRVLTDNGTFNDLNSGNPRLYSQEVGVSNPAAIARVDLTYVSGGRCSLFALSGGDAAGVWTPIPVTGFNKDVIFGVDDPVPGGLSGFTTVSMDGGTANTGNTWYERGYFPGAPDSGLPPQGTTFTSSSLPDHHYLMPADYTALNAVYVDSGSPTATITLATPANYSALSFLNATANGAVTVECTLNYEDGSSEVQTFVAKDWFNGTPFAYNAAGRVNLDNKILNNHVNGTNPRLYEAEFFLNNTVSKIVSVNLQFLNGGGNARVAILAVSAAAGSVRPIYSGVPVSQNVYENSPATFTAVISGGTAPITLRWQKNINGVFTNLADGPNISGATTASLTINAAGFADAGEYQLVATNAVGNNITPPAGLTVISTLPDVTSPFDTVLPFGGAEQVGEAALNAVDNVAQKYLNFGSGPNPNAVPFAGPAGLQVTPAVGSTVVTGLRIYTANDTPGRDPVDYTVEGSNDDGATFTIISTGPLALPEGRNGVGAVALDPITQFVSEIPFSNTQSFTSYRVSFLDVKDPAGVNSMQIAEIELLGSFTPSLDIVAGVNPGEFEIRSNRAGTLQTAPRLDDPALWMDVQPIDPITPYLFTPAANEPRRFYRALTN